MEANVQQAVPFFAVSDMKASLHYYIDGLGFEMKKASRPFVGNRMWVTSLRDPDGYRLEFESSTDTPEETVFSE